MKTIVIILVVVGCLFWFGSGCSEKVDASIDVIKNKSEMALVENAGKGDVILEIAEKRIDALRKRVIGIKAAKRSFKRKLALENLSQEAKSRYTDIYNELEVYDQKGEAALLNARVKFDELRAKVEVIETEIAMAKSTSKIINEANPKYRRDELKKIMESLLSDLDKANSELDVAVMEAK